MSILYLFSIYLVSKKYLLSIYQVSTEYLLPGVISPRSALLSSCGCLPALKVTRLKQLRAAPRAPQLLCAAAGVLPGSSQLSHRYITLAALQLRAAAI